jgi:hypothetical protein
MSDYIYLFVSASPMLTSCADKLFDIFIDQIPTGTPLTTTTTTSAKECLDNCVLATNCLVSRL